MPYDGYFVPDFVPAPSWVFVVRDADDYIVSSGIAHLIWQGSNTFGLAHLSHPSITRVEIMLM